MRRQVLVRAAGAVLSGPARHKGLVVFPGLSEPDSHIEGIHFLRGRDKQEIVHALGRGAAVVGIRGHGDGLDMQLGERVVLCGVLSGRGSVDDAPDCVRGHHCYRLERPLEEALAHDNLMASSAISCRLAILSSCSTIPATKHRTRPDWSLLAPMIRSPGVGSVIAPWGMSSQAFVDFDALVRAAVSGCTAGEVLAQFHESADSRSSRYSSRAVRRPALVGVPTRCHAPPRGQRVGRWDGAPHGSPGPLCSGDQSGCEGRAHLLLALIELARYARQPGNDTDAADVRASDALVRLVRRAIAERLPSRRLMRNVGIAAARFFRRGEPIWSYIDSLMYAPIEVGPRSRCEACGEDILTFRYETIVPGVGARLRTLCERCGLISDIEEETAHAVAQLKMSQDVVVFPESLHADHIVGTLRVRDWDHGSSRVYERAPLGVSCQVEGGLHRGTTTIQLLAFEDLEIIHLRMLVERPWPKPRRAQSVRTTARTRRSRTT